MGVCTPPQENPGSATDNNTIEPKWNALLSILHEINLQGLV